MKILYHHRIGSKDGQYVHIEEMVAALRRAGHIVEVVGPEGFEAQDFGGESGLVAALKARIPGAAYELLELGYNSLDYRRLARAIVRFQPDVIYERYNLSLLSGVLARQRFGIPLLLEVNAPLYAERSAYGGLALPRLARWAESRAWQGADHVFAVTEVLAARIVAAGVPRARLSVTPNGIDAQRFHRVTDEAPYKQALGLAGRTVLGFVGFAREWHGLDGVVEMLAADAGVHDLHCLIVGDGPACEGLRAQAATRGVADRLTITGIVGRNDIMQYIGAFDIALVPAVVAYASPLKLFEYMACGRAIVAPDQPNITEILTDGQDALLFAPGSRTGFTDAVRRLITDHALRARLAEAAHASCVARDLSWSANARQVGSVAERLCADR
ncbi:glycosyltransferase family 4 protein [Salinisphaera sp. Q1T1-3]|uniref:glycosyltransferase family 4 protein n=1 Tax=Salinisphaera sp. Q1T1-3 TaxID=2321229 RepID=UPI000E72565B|nr:glycosyltransferase family 4 protein [Salinisphaera sp. Q1T1-3]RJS94725.1 glycosyltransferase family 1 protein [Salinisphaera sp. Q1T1-3]